MKKSMLFLALALGAFATQGCHDHGDDAMAPVVLINEPTSGASLPNNTELHMHCTLTDESLHELYVTLKDITGDSILASYNPIVHDSTSYTFHEHFTPSLAQTSTLRLLVEVEDHSGNVTRDSVNFTVTQ